MVVALYLTLTAILPAETDIWDYYRNGDMVQLQQAVAAIPDTLPEKLFFKALFDEDGNRALEKFASFVAKYPRSKAAPYAFERMIAGKLATGESAGAIALQKNLKRDYPDFNGIPDLKLKADLLQPDTGKTVDKINEKRSTTAIWSVQVGAFRNRKGAETVGEEVKKYGKVRLIEKKNRKGAITTVLIGGFETKEDAEKTVKLIEKHTDLKPIVVRGKDGE